MKKVIWASRSIALVACLVFNGFRFSYSYGQVVSGRPTTTPQQTTQQKTTSPREVTITKHSFTPVKVSATELRTINEAMSAKTFTSSQTLTTAQKSAVVQPIVVSTPVNNDIWEAGKEYTITWNGAKNDVKIELVTLSTAGKPIEKHTITSRTANTGTYRFKVPNQWLRETQGHKVVIETTDGKQSGASQGTITVYTQPVDLECQIVDSKLKWEEEYKVLYIETKTWVEFNVLMRNKGTRSPVTIQNVVVRIIKEPEGIVCVQEEWGFSGIYPQSWYRLPEPRKFDVSSRISSFGFADEDVNLKTGSYRVEVELDPQNNLGELQELRHNNKDVQIWRIH